MIGSFDWMDFLYVFAITIVGIAAGITLRILFKHRNINGIKLPWIKKKMNAIKLIMLCTGIVLIILQITQFIWLAVNWKNGTGAWTDEGGNGIEKSWIAYIPLFISSYYMYFYVGYGVSKDKSFCNSMWAAGIYIIALLLVVFMYAIPSTIYNAVYTLSQHQGKYQNYYAFLPWYSMIYHTIAMIVGIIFLIVSPYRINAYKDLLKTWIPLAIFGFIAFIVSSSCSKWSIHYDAFGNFTWVKMLEQVYDGVGKNIWLYNLCVWIVVTGLYGCFYYAYYFMGVVMPWIFTKIKHKHKSHQL